jgi:iron complex transport system substrate-binding protein
MRLARRAGLATALAAICLPALAAGSVASAAGSIAVRDGLGREVRLPAPPQRIVSIFASNTELLVALGLAERIVGIEDFTRYPPGIRDGRAIVGGRLGFSAEAIARLRPDLVVMTPSRGAAQTLIRPLALVGIATLVLVHRDLAQIFANLALLGEATAEPAAASRTIAALQRRLAAVRARISARPPARVFVELGANDRGALQTVRAGTYTADAIALAGGANVFAGLSGITQVSAEAVQLADPDVILVARDGFDPASLARRPGWAGLRALRSGRVHAVPRALLLIPGPRVVAGVERMARLLHPDADRHPA